MSSSSHTFAQRYRLLRVRTARLFSLIDEAAYYEQPIALRHPVVFYEGHLPAFSFNTLVKSALGDPMPEPGGRGRATNGAPRKNNGITGDGRPSSAELGKVEFEMKIDYAVRQIRGFVQNETANCFLGHVV